MKARRSTLALSIPLAATFAVIGLPCLIWPGPASGAPQQSTVIPSGEFAYGDFVGSFSTAGDFRIVGEDGPLLAGTRDAAADELTLVFSEAPDDCDGLGRYIVRMDSGGLHLTVVTDECAFRQLMFDGSSWWPVGEEAPVPERRIVVTTAPVSRPLPDPTSDEGSWPSFRGQGASGIADAQNLPDTWSGESGDNVLWQIPIPGLAHSSPVVWGDRVYVTSSISSDSDATFLPGLYGDGFASTDRSTHQWVIFAIDKHTGEPIWERVAHEGTPIGKRHIKSTYASSTPATDGRIVVASFGSEGVYAYDVGGSFLWKVDLGHLDLGAFDVPTAEWGPASSPIIWNELVIVQCDTQQDSFVLALDALTGEIVWKTDRDELPTWGTPNVVPGPDGAELVTNGSVFIRGYDPESGEELWRLGGSSKITAPTPIYAAERVIVASGRHPQRPIFVLRPGPRGDITLQAGQTSNDSIAWSRTGRGPYMPTPLAYRGVLYSIQNNGVLDAYDLATGEELYRTRVPHLGSGFSASPVASDGRIYLSNEDGDIVVIKAGSTFEHLSTNPMGELLMATPAISDRVMYVRSVSSLFAIGDR